MKPNNIVPFVQPDEAPSSEQEKPAENKPERESLGWIRKKFYSSIHWETKRIDGDYDEDHYLVSIEKKEFTDWCNRNKVSTGPLPRTKVGDLGATLLVAASERLEDQEAGAAA